MFRALLLVAILAVATAFGPARMRMSMKTESVQSKMGKVVGAMGLGLSLMGPMVAPVMADGAVSASTVYRARNSYGAKIVGLADAAAKGDFAAFTDKKVVNAFDLFISASNAQKGIKQKETKKAELAIQAQLYDAVKAKNAANLKSAYDEFIKVANLKSEYKASDVGQTDSSGYSPTWGTERQQIYQR